MGHAGVIDGQEELTAEWLGEALRRQVTSVSVERIGTGQIGSNFRVTLDGEDGPASVVAKLAGGDDAARDRVKEGFRKEVAFYTELAATVDVRTPRCGYGAISHDHRSFTLLLEDLSPAQPGVQADGCSAERAGLVMENLSGLHAARWDDETLHDSDALAPTDEAAAGFIGDIHRSATDEFLERYGDALGTVDAETLRSAAEATGTWLLTRPRPLALLHGDHRPDNLMFSPAGDRVWALDWQTISTGPPLRDVAYFLGTSLSTELRRQHEEVLVATYHDALVARGVSGYSRQDCWDDYRLGQLHAPLITVLGAVYATAERSTATDRMFLAMATRSAAAIRDLGTLELLV